MENNMEIPQKIKSGTTIWFIYSTSGYLSKGYKNTDSKRYMHPYLHIIYTAQDTKAT